MGRVRKVVHGPNFYAESFGASFKVIAPTVLLLEVPDHCWWLNIGGLLYMSIIGWDKPTLFPGLVLASQYYRLKSEPRIEWPVETMVLKVF